MYVSLENISLTVGLLYTGLLNAWFSLARSEHGQTIPFFIGTSMKLLHDSNILPTPSGTSICFLIGLLDSFLNGSWSMYALCWGGAKYSFTPFLASEENVPLRHPIPEETSL